MTALLPAHLTETLNNLGDAARALTDEVRADRRARRHRDRRMMALLVVLALLVVALAALGLMNRRTNEQNAELVRQIKDCTTAGGACYERGQARTGSAVAQVVRAQVFIDLCGRDPGNDTAAEMQACVAELAATAPR